MPIPKPKKGEKKGDFTSRCISQLLKEDPNKAPDQIQAICFKAWKTRGEKMEEEIKRDEDGHIIVAENVKISFGGYINESIGISEEDKEEKSDKDAKEN